VFSRGVPKCNPRSWSFVLTIAMRGWHGAAQFTTPGNPSDQRCLDNQEPRIFKPGTPTGSHSFAPRNTARSDQILHFPFDQDVVQQGTSPTPLHSQPREAFQHPNNPTSSSPPQPCCSPLSWPLLPKSTPAPAPTSAAAFATPPAP
jgi:hypothetical protein